jgi:hypothetical protein
MLATLITTHVQDGLARLAEQYKGKPLITSYYTANLQQYQDLENAIYNMNSATQLWDGTTTPAIGQQLDNIGQIVGISRNGLDDAQYILFIFGKIAENFSQTTLNNIASVVGYLFQATTVVIQELPPAGLLVDIFGSAIPSSLFELAISLVQNAMGAGIQLVFSSASNNTNIFRFAGPGETSANGFGDVNNPLTGGDFIGIL